MTRKKIHLLFVVLTLLSVAVVNQSCLTSMIVAGAIGNKKLKNRLENSIKQAEDNGPLDCGEYRVSLTTELVSTYDSRKKMWQKHNENHQDKVVSLLNSKGYSVVNINGNSMDFVPTGKLQNYFYKKLAGNDFSELRKGKACVLGKYDGWFGVSYKPDVSNVYWSGEVVDGYINGKGSGVNINNLKMDESGRAEGNFIYFEGEYIYGIPVTDVKAYFIDMGKIGNINEISPTIYPKQETKFFLEEYRDKLDQAMLDNFVKGNTDFQYEKVRNLIADYKKYAEDIILNEKTPKLSQGIYGRNVLALMPSQEMVLVIPNSPEEYNKRHTLEAFKNSEGIDINNIKELLSLDNKPLLESIDQTFKYMDLLDGLALTSGKCAEQAQSQYNFSYIRQFGAPDIERSNYYSVLDNAINIAKELEKSSTGSLREKYAVAGQKISNWKKTITGVKNSVYSEVNVSEKKSKEREQERKRKGQHEIDRYNTKDPSGKLVEMSGLFSSYKTYEHDGRISTKGGDYCDYNIIYSRDGKLNCYRITYSTKKSVDKKDFKSLAELTEHFLSK